MQTLKKLIMWSFPAAEKEKPEMENSEKYIFSVGMFGQNLIYAMVGTYLSVFYSTVIFVPALALLVITIISRAWDAVNDILMGMIVDKTNSRWGKCRPYLKFVPIPVAIFTVLMFMPVKELSDFPKVVFVLFTWLGWEFIYTLGDIPIWGMTSLMTSDAQKRSQLVACARMIGGISTVIAVIFEPVVNVFASKDIGWFEGASEKIGYDYYSYQQGYFFAVLLFACIGGILFKLPFITARERVTPVIKKNEITPKQSFKLIWENKFFLRTILSNILGCTRNLLMSAGIYFCMWVLADGKNYTPWLLALGGPFLAGSFIAMGISSFLSKKFGKIKVLIATSYLCVAAYAIMFAVFFIFGKGTLQIIIMAVCLLFAGVCSGFPSVYNTTMIADSIDYMEWKHGNRNDGVFLSGLNFCSKLTNAITLAITYAVFFAVSYTPRIEALEKAIKAGKDTLIFTQEYPDITLALLVLITIVPAVGSILQALPLHGYKLDEKMHGKIMSELTEMRSNANELTKAEEV